MNDASFAVFIFVVTFWITRWSVVQSTFHLTTWLAMSWSLTSVSSLILWWRPLAMSLCSRKLLTTWKHSRYSCCILVAVCVCRVWFLLLWVRCLKTLWLDLTKLCITVGLVVGWCLVPSLPYLTFGVGRLLHLPSAEAISVRPNAQPRCNQRSQ